MKAAVIGAGFIGNIHADAISETEGIEVKTVLDRNRELGEKLASKCNAVYTTNIDDILNDNEIEVVIHGLPTEHRLEFLKKYIEAEKHILCEKPLALTMDEADAIRDLLEGYEKTFMVGHVVRFFWEYKSAREMILNGDIGRPGIARVSRICGAPSSFVKEDNWYMDTKRSGGVFHDLAIHDLDWLLWTFGPVKTRYAQSTSNKNGIMDYGLGILKFDNGVLAHVEASWIEAPGTFRTAFEVSGSEGIIEYDLKDAQSVNFALKKPSEGNKAGTAVPESPTLESPYTTQMKHLVKCIQNGAAPLAGIEEAHAALKLALDLRKSAETGEEV